MGLEGWLMTIRLDHFPPSVTFDAASCTKYRGPSCQVCHRSGSTAGSSSPLASWACSQVDVTPGHLRILERTSAHVGRRIEKAIAPKLADIPHQNWHT